MDTAQATDQPSNRSPTGAVAAGIVTGSTKASRAAVVAAANWPFTAPAKTTPKPTSTIPRTAVSTRDEHSVPSATR